MYRLIISFKSSVPIESCSRAYTLSTSAVSGHKIDFVTEDYITKPLVFSKDINGRLIADKITLTPTTSSGYTLSSYALPITGADLGYDFGTKLGNFENPTNVYSMEQTFKEYENKFCVLTRFDNEYAGSPLDIGMGNRGGYMERPNKW